MNREREPIGSRVLVVAGALAVVATLASSGACSSQSAGFEAASDASVDAAASEGASDDVGRVKDDSSCSGDIVHCSDDLHAVLDCRGQIRETCTPDKGCARGACVPACEAAIDGKNTLGCEYYDIVPGGWDGCFAMYVVNTWSAPVRIDVDFAGVPLDTPSFARIPTGTGASITYAPLPGDVLPPGEVAVLFLLGGPTSFHGSCPIPGANPPGGSNAGGTGIHHAFHVVTSAPVVAYDAYPFGGGAGAVTSATLLMPTSAWDSNYVAVAPWPFGINEWSPKTAIVALDDDTDVTISPSAAIVGGNGVSPTPKGVPHTYRLARGEVLQLEQDAELTGSPIQSTKPIGVWGAQDCIDIGPCCCDSAHQQLAPVRALGHEYVAVRYRDRVDGQTESPPWRFVGIVDGTTLTYEPSAPAGAPTSLALGQIATFHTPGPFVVRSQGSDHPFYASAHMTGGKEFLGRGDPEFVNVVPTHQYQKSYVFFTDPSYPETNLVVIRARASDGELKPVNLDCAGFLTGWQAVDPAARYEYARIDLSRHAFEPQGACDNGRHAIRSGGPFALTVWGWGSNESAPVNSGYVSYAYPAGAGVQSINTVIVPPAPR